MSVDVAKSSSYTQLKDKLISLYFPDGVSLKGYSIQDMDVKIATYAGEGITETMRNGEVFTVEAFYKLKAVSPLRLYLFTRPKEVIKKCSCLTLRFKVKIKCNKA